MLTAEVARVNFHFLGLFTCGMLAAAITFPSSASLEKAQRLPWSWITLVLTLVVLADLLPKYSDYLMGFWSASFLIMTSLHRDAWQEGQLQASGAEPALDLRANRGWHPARASHKHMHASFGMTGGDSMTRFRTAASPQPSDGRSWVHPDSLALAKVFASIGESFRYNTSTGDRFSHSTGGS